MPEHTITIPHLTPPHRLLYIQGGRFRMGSDEHLEEAKFDGKPAHEVTLSDFWISEFVVSQRFWMTIMNSNPSHNKGEHLPVEHVSWFDAVVFCNHLSVEVGLKPCYKTLSGQIFGLTAKNKWELLNEGEVTCDFSANGYRLPTEAEWEYAARGGATNHVRSGVYAGGDLLDQVGWYDGNSDNHTREVGLLLPNALGLYDMSGNVWEWCHDWYAKYDNKHQVNPHGPEKGSLGVVRGGSYSEYAQSCRATYRYKRYGRNSRHPIIGFRLALSCQEPI